MSLCDLPDVALLKIFRTLDHVELVRLYHSFHSSERIQRLIHHSPCLWTRVHLKATGDYHFLTCFCRLFVSNASTVRQLIIDELDLTCRNILFEQRFSLKQFTTLEQLTLHDTVLSNNVESFNFCSPTLNTLRLTNSHEKLQQINQLKQLTTLQCTLYSVDMLQNPFDRLTNLQIKIMFDYDHHSREIFSRLPNRNLQIFTLQFLVLNNNFNFSNEFQHYLTTCQSLHTLELSYLHGMCPLPLHTHITYSCYHRLILINICELKTMKTHVQTYQIDLPHEYLQYNSTVHRNQSSNCIKQQFWHTREVISIDYIQCVTTSMELFNDLHVIWSDRNQTSQSFEAYILRSIYNEPQLTFSLRSLSISKFELSLNGLVILMTSLPLVRDLSIADGKIDQMGSGISDMEKIIQMIGGDCRSDISTIGMTNIQMSRRTAVKLCLMTETLVSLTLDDVRISEKRILSDTNGDPTRSSFLVFLTQIPQFQWKHLKSLTFGKNMINQQNLFTFIPSSTNNIYSSNLNHLRLIMYDHTLFETHEKFLKSMKKLIKLFPDLISFIIEFPKRYEGYPCLRNQLQVLFQSTINRRIYVYPTLHDRACRFCFDSNEKEEEEEERFSSQMNRTFCGIPLFFSFRKQRNASVCT